MADKINIIVERDGEFHKFKFGNGDCRICSLKSGGDLGLDACDICTVLLQDGHYEKVVTK